MPLPTTTAMMWPPTTTTTTTTTKNTENNNNDNDNQNDNNNDTTTAATLSTRFPPAHIIRGELQSAVRILSHVCLKKASAWASEQVLGLGIQHDDDEVSGGGGGDRSGNHDDDDDDDDHNDNHFSVSLHSYLLSHTTDREWYAKSLLELGDYLHAAAVLSRRDNDDSDNHHHHHHHHTVGQYTRPYPSSTSSSSSSNPCRIQEGLAELSPCGVFLRAYALYMAGERRKHQDVLELKDPLERTAVVNPYLTQLCQELEPLYDAPTMTTTKTTSTTTTTSTNVVPTTVLNAFGLYVHGMVLHQQGQDPKRAARVLLESLYRFPYNWSAWLDLASLCVEHADVYETVVQPFVVAVGMDTNTAVAQHDAATRTTTTTPAAAVTATTSTGGGSLQAHYMYGFFTAHLMLELQQNEQSLWMLDNLHRQVSSFDPASSNDGTTDATEPATEPHADPSTPLSATTTTTTTTTVPSSTPKHDGSTPQELILFASPFVLSKIAVNYYQLRDFAAAAEYFATLLQLDPHRLDHMDVYSNILYVAEDRPGLTKLAHWAIQLDKYRPETCCIVGNYYSLLGQRSKAVTYFQRALKLDASYTSAWTLMGHEFVELKNTAAAMESYRRAVDVSPQDYRAWYGLGQTYELLNMHLYALFYYRKAASLRRYDARMWCAIGGCYQSLGRKQDAIRSYQRAVSNTDREGIATQKLAALYRQDGSVEEAAQCYMRHLELRYQATAPQQPEEDEPAPPLHILINSVTLEEAVAEALLFLSNYYRDHGEYETAALCCSRLLEYPGPEKEEGKALLREIRSRREQSSGGRVTSPRRSLGGRESPRRRSRRGRDDSSMEFSP